MHKEEVPAKVSLEERSIILSRLLPYTAIDGSYKDIRASKITEVRIPTIPQMVAGLSGKVLIGLEVGGFVEVGLNWLTRNKDVCVGGYFCTCQGEDDLSFFLTAEEMEVYAQDARPLDVPAPSRPQSSYELALIAERTALDLKFDLLEEEIELLEEQKDAMEEYSDVLAQRIEKLQK